ncbi:agamous-like MADS-box protein AGL9 homolog isoform X2 [Salvia splendens]|uniref:agamous-like MADS-box protein AGL9 homolog isoform X2 n=1 Tax=Salvia splendens TaxID=180675 RepID=UPI001C25F29B|nr:agamous-like MADS-box protein AGL9 homolog isoform X2 [Salvia splendens]
MAKSENREAGFNKRRVSLFKKAKELAVLCDAQIAIIIISSHGKVHEFATNSSMQEILTRYKMCNQLKNRNALQLNQENPEEEVPKEAGVSGQQKADELKSRKLFGKDLTGMSSHELNGLVKKLKEGMLFIKDTKMQLLKNELEKSRKQEQLVVQKNQMLQRQVKELQNFYPRAYYPMPISIHCPATEHDRGLLPHTNRSAQLAITGSSEPEHHASNEISPPSASSAEPKISDCGSPTQRNPQKPADKDSSKNHSGSKSNTS